MDRPRVLVLSRNYPSPVLPHLGLWVERPTVQLRDRFDVQVVAPVPWCPPLPPAPAVADFARFRHVPQRQVRHGIQVHHPRFPIGPGYRFHDLDARGYFRGVRGAVARLRQWFPFDLIHAHFGYPDGVVGERLGRIHGVPVVVTEHAPWLPWMERYPRVAAQSVPAARRLARHMAVSRAVRDTIVSFTGDPDRVSVVPVGVDERVFRPANDRDPDKILFVGMPRPGTKGLDVLLDAMERVASRRPAAHLVLVGGALFRGQRPHLAELRNRAAQAPLRGRVSFTGPLPPREVAAHMASAAVLVLPSRLESFGAVLVEALACGTPVVSTRCGGPEDIVTDEVGTLVPTAEPAALADALVATLAAPPDRYPRDVLRAYAVQRFSWSSVAERIGSVYEQALTR